MKQAKVMGWRCALNGTGSSMTIRKVLEVILMLSPKTGQT